MAKKKRECSNPKGFNHVLSRKLSPLETIFILTSSSFVIRVAFFCKPNCIWQAFAINKSVKKSLELASESKSVGTKSLQLLAPYTKGLDSLLNEFILYYFLYFSKSRKTRLFTSVLFNIYCQMNAFCGAERK